MDSLFKPGQGCWTICRVGPDSAPVLVVRPCVWTGKVSPGGLPIVKLDDGAKFAVEAEDVFHTRVGCQFKVHTLEIPIRLANLKAI